MRQQHVDHIGKLMLACSIQAAIVAARQERAEQIALELEDLLAELQPDFEMAA